MPHQADYFVLAYSWDNHCLRLHDLLEGRLSRIEAEVEEAQRDGTPRLPDDRRTRLRAAREESLHALAAIKKREYIINSLGYRGYGVNRDLLAALQALDDKGQRLGKRIDALIDGGGSGVCADAPSQAREEKDLDLALYWRVMARETSMETNAAIFQRMFFSGGKESMTIMKGSTGLYNGYSCQELKQRGNANFVHAVRKIFEGLSDYAEIGIDMLKGLHYDLTAGIDPKAGSFREIDFPDRNGVTFEFDNFYREVSDLSIVLDETARSFHCMEDFIYNLARAYYMFIGIHPFWDGNGRVGRCFLNSMFLKKGLPPITLPVDDEVLALPRYGGSMEQMHDYLKGRLQRAAATYLYERSKLGDLGFFGKRVYNTAFDSGFHFRQIDDLPKKIEVGFEVLVIAEDDDLSGAFKEECRIVLPDACLVPALTVYCGLCDAPFSEWSHSFRLKGALRVKETSSEIGRVRNFDVDLVLDVPRQARNGELFACSVVCEERGLLFNNKELNYSYRLDL